MTDVPCELLHWDTAFFGKRIGRIRGGALDAARADEALAWCSRERIEVLYLLAGADDTPTIRQAEDVGFRMVDIRVNLEAEPNRAIPVEDDIPVRLVREGDLPALQTIARTAFRDSRFYQDDGFARSDCDRLYATWVENSLRGYAAAVLVAGDVASPTAGFITCHTEGSQGRIGLIATAEAARGRGVGRALVHSACRYFAERGCVRAAVATQARNARALRLYERCGFTTVSVQLWYHYWPAHARRGRNGL